jgi:hypothetical protein
MSYLNGSGPASADGTMSGLIQMVFTKDTMLTISSQHKEWENIARVKVAGHDPRSILYSITKSLGSQAVQPRARGRVSLPKAQGAKYQEAEARLKRIYSAIEIDYDLFEGAKVTPNKYADPIAKEIQLKSTAQKRYLSGVLNRDGSCILATVESEGFDDLGDRVLHFQSAPSCGGAGAGHLEFDEVYAVCSASSASVEGQTKTEDTEDASVVLVPQKYVRVEDVERSDNDNYVVFIECDADGKAVATTSFAGGGVEVLCKISAWVPVVYVKSDESGFERPKTGELSQQGWEIGGMYAIANADGATYNGLTAKGSTKVSEIKANSGLADLDHLQRVMDKLANKLGTYSYNQMTVSPSVKRTFLQAQESDKRIINASDDKRGFKGFGFQHDNDLLLCDSSLYAFKQEVNVIPKDVKGVVQMHGADFKDFKVGSTDSFPGLDGQGNYETAILKYMYGTMTFICNNPAAIGRVKNVGILETD